MKYIKILLIVLAALLAGCGNNGGDTKKTNEKTALTISAAASMTDAMNELKGVYEKENNVELTFNLGGSGKLAQQIQQGAPVDVFISANQDWMERLEKKQQILPDTRAAITGNSIVLIAGTDSELRYDTISDIAANEVDQIAIGNPESVPAGKYTQQTLESLGLWGKLEAAFVLAKDVRQVLTYVETGNTDIGFVYKSDAMISDKINVLAETSANTHDPIIYPAAVIADTKQKEAAKAFVNFLQSADAQAIFEKYGFKK